MASPSASCSWCSETSRYFCSSHSRTTGETPPKKAVSEEDKWALMELNIWLTAEGWGCREPYLQAHGQAQSRGKILRNLFPVGSITHSPREQTSRTHKALFANVNQAPEASKYLKRQRCKSLGRTSKAKKSFSWRQSISALGISRVFTMAKRG